MQKQFFWLGGALALLGAAVWRGRPAPMLRVHMVARMPGSPPVARLTLKYGTGARPQSVILDVEGPDGAGSATIGGSQEFVDVPIIGELNSQPRITATAAYRVLGRLRERVDVFQNT
ncbi:MAG TPA: hypothetical protein VFT66_17045 [Roseiflexaceae bacterium]|jgi:hypothetical protein|nr:hypothetical protein [Roseiflexaceae bacterium]